jgi:hypothetical protein
VEGTGLETLCHIADNEKAFKERMEQLYHQPFTTSEIECRRTLLNAHFNNEASAREIVNQIWGTEKTE